MGATEDAAARRVIAGTRGPADVAGRITRLCLIAALCDQLVDQTEAGGHYGEACPDAREDRVAPFQHEAIVVGPCDENVACLDAKTAPERRRHGESSLRADRHLDRC